MDTETSKKDAMSKIKVVTSVKEMGYLIERIIEGAEQCLHIISPYVKLDNQIKALLADKHVLNGLEIHLTYGRRIVWIRKQKANSTR